MEKIFYKKILVAIRITRIPKGSIPATEDTQPLQLVTLKHPKGTYLQAHTHIPKKRVTSFMQECLIVKKGKVKIELYDRNKDFFKSLFLMPGDILILVQGGYGIKMLKDSELIEIKNGPFIKDKLLI